MQWTEFLDTAERLARGGTEGDWRSAISRAYYAVFHYFGAFLQAHGLSLGRAGQSHFNLYASLLHCGFPQVADIARRVDKLRGQRGDADYELAPAIDQTEALTSVRAARAITADFQALLLTLPATQIVGGARAHLRAIGRIV